MRVLVTGGNGFVGRALVSRLAQEERYSVRVATRAQVPELANRVEVIPGCDLLHKMDWQPALEGVDVVVHAAARVHIMQDVVKNPLEEFRKVNLDGTMHLATQAETAGVRRFVFVSSIKVNGENTRYDQPFFADDKPQPADPYAISKAEAESALRQLAAKSGMEVVIIRPVLVYGAGVGANFLSMMHWLSRGYPLPLGDVRNKRSLVALENLVDLIECCISHPKAANQTFLVSDGVHRSTTEILTLLGGALGKPPRLLSIPTLLLQLGAKMVGQGERAQRLLGSLHVDISKNESLLGWTPPVEQEWAFHSTAKWFLESK